MEETLLPCFAEPMDFMDTKPTVELIKSQPYSVIRQMSAPPRTMSQPVSPSKRVRLMEAAQERDNETAQSAVLKEPTLSCPWRIQIIRCLPTALPLSDAVTALHAGPWMCTVSKSHSLRGYQLHVWHNQSSTHGSTQEMFGKQKFQTPVLSLVHPKLTQSSEPPLVALHMAQGQETTMHSPMEDGAGAMMQQQQQQHHHAVGSHDGKEALLYVALPEGSLCLWKLSASAIQSNSPPSPKSFAVLDLEDAPGDDDEMNSNDGMPTIGQELATCLTVQHGNVFVSTSWGRVFMIHQIQGILQQEHRILENAAIAMAANASGSSGGWSFSRYLFGSSKSAEGSKIPPEVAEGGPNAALLMDVIPSNGGDSLITVTPAGRLVAYHADNETKLVPLSAIFLKEEFGKVLAQQKASFHVSNLVVLKVAAGTFPPGLAASSTRCLHVVVLVAFGDPPHVDHRLYWLQVAYSSQNQQKTWEISGMTWLNRFASPETVRVMGLYVAENGVGYAALVRDGTGKDSSVSSIPILMAHDPFNRHVYEVDLDLVGETRVLGFFGDDRTHGCTFCTSSGTLILCECKDATESALSGEHAAEMQQGHQKEDPLKVKSLMSHLRATFWESYHHPEKTIVLPPSLECADKSDLEAAVWKMGEELQFESKKGSGMPSSTNLVLTWHLEYIEFLQRAGIYRSMMALTKWHLMALGQEIAAFQAIATSQHTNENMEKFRETLNCFAVASWLQSMQKVMPVHTEEMNHIYSCWLEQALTAAHAYRQERCTLLYDISSSAEPPKVDKANSIPLWMSKPIIQSVLFTQLENWRNDKKSLLPLSNEVESIVVASLRSFADSYLAFPCKTTQNYYCKMQSYAINLLRETFGTERDALAWSLCKEHRYFAGLCKIAHDHRTSARGAADDFSLTPLFPKMANLKDWTSEMSFGQYVIKWHIDRKYIGEALQYGNLCQDDLLVMVNSEAGLRNYRWLVALQRKDHEAATRNLLEVVDRANTGLSLAQAKFNLSMAKLSNKIVVSKSVSNRESALERGRKIENLREIAQVQGLLLGEQDAQNSYRWTVESLLEYALEKIDREEGIDAKAETCFLALCLCCSLEVGGVEARKEAACNVWYKALVSDWDFIADLLHGKRQSLTDEGIANAVLQKSVFGKLMEQCESNLKSSWGEISFDNIVQRFVMDKIDSPNDRSSMQRLFRAVLTKV